MKKTRLLPLWLVLAAVMPAQQIDAACSYPTMTRSDGARHLSNFAISDGSNTATINVNQGSSYGSAIYYDKTSETPLNTLPGTEISFTTIAWSGSWMHGYVFVDYDKDGDYDSTLNADGTGDGELVAYTYYNGKNSKGETSANDSGVDAGVMPSFTLPADLAPGDYKALFKVDWDNIDPCGASDIGANGGAAVEFIIHIDAAAERTVTVKSANPAMGSVAIEGVTGNSVTSSGGVTVIATPNKGYSFIKWTDEATGAVKSELPTFTVFNNSDITLVANFDNLTYPTMKRYFNSGSSQSNRYLKTVTTTGTKTPVVFECSSTAELPYTAYTSGANSMVEAGANIDKTANPIIVEGGVNSFRITYKAWTDDISGLSSQMNWTQEACFIDWNNDGLFLGEGENLGRSWENMPNADILSDDGVSRTVTIPEGQPAGTYRMRVVFFEPQNASTDWSRTLFTTLGCNIRNGVSYDMVIRIEEPADMSVTGAEVLPVRGKTNPETENVILAKVNVNTTGTLNPLAMNSIKASYTGTSTADITNLRWIYSTTGFITTDVVATKASASDEMTFDITHELSAGNNYFILLADIAAEAVVGNTIGLNVTEVKADGKTVAVEDNSTADDVITIVDEPDYTLGNALWFNEANSSTAGAAVWNRNDFSSTDTNPDQIWERKSFPIGNGSFGGNVLGSINRERVVLNEKTLWMGGPGTGASSYWDMNREVSDATLSQIRTYLQNGQTSLAHSLVTSNYSGKISYTRAKFGTYTTMGEAYVSTGINESSVTDYKRILNIDRSLAVVQFKVGDASYTRKYFASYPDNVMVWNYSSDEPQNLTFSFTTPQVVNAVEAVDGGLLYKGSLSNNSMEWAMQVYVRVNGAGTVTPNATARTITISGATDVDFILAGDTDYKMNFNPSYTDPATYVGEDPVANIGEWIDAAKEYTYDQLYKRHYEDYSKLYKRTDIAINPEQTFENVPTPTRLSRYRQGTLDHQLEQIYFQYGRYLLISSSREGNMPANLQGMWHNNIDGPWRVDYHNNINLQMNYWPATCTNLLECFTPLIDYVRGLVEPGKRTAKAYYGARGWTAEVSTNIFGFTAPLNANDMSWNYNPTAGPWLATQMWEYYDYTRDKQWLRDVGYEIIKESANFCSDLLYFVNGSYTSAPSYSPEHGSIDLGATYANAVTREILKNAITAAEILDVDAENVAEWKEKLDKMYPYQVGRYGQLQEWYNDIDTYNDTHRHTNHLFGLHPGTTINATTDTELVAACKETLKQRGDAATGWSMGWKLNHWARLLDGDHAYVLFKNLLKNGTADNLWDLHPPFQIDGNFGGTAGVAELFLQSHNGMLHILPALPADWTDGHISGLLARGNFEVDINYADHELSRAVIRSNAGEDCSIYYNGVSKTFPTEKGAEYEVTFDKASNTLNVNSQVGIEDNLVDSTAGAGMKVYHTADNAFTVVLDGPAEGSVIISVYTVTGQCVKTLSVNKTEGAFQLPLSIDAAPGVYIIRANGSAISESAKVIVK